MGTQTERIVIDVGADISKARAAMGELKKIFSNTELGADLSKKITSMFSELGRNLDSLERKSSTALSSLGDATAVKKAKDNVQDLITGIADEFGKIKGLGDNELAKNFIGMADSIKSSTKAFKAYDEALDKITKDEKDAEALANKTAKAYQDAAKVLREISNFRKGLNEPSLTGKSNLAVSNFLLDLVNALKVAKDDADKYLQDFLSKNNLNASDVLNLSGTANKNWVKKNGELGTDLLDIAQLAVDAGNKFSDAQKKYSDFLNLLSKKVSAKELTDLKDQADKAKLAFDNLVGNKGQLSETAFNNLKKSLSDIFGADLFKNITNSSNAVLQFQNAIKNFQTDKILELRKLFPEIDNLLNELGDSAKSMGDKVNEGAERFSIFKEASSEVEHLSSRLKYFFSLAGGFNLMRRAIRDAVNTTKELDAVMTLTAVVSKNTVADMWKTLPQYSKEAKKLGAEIKDVYSAQTLYVLQGLDMNSAMDLGTETLKMARVAGIDAAEATNSMTAALRGFNMELNETSAQRINDVYSKLAQNTASNVQEISTAMSKVAALANSANMSFENTSAFLATIIESTREGAETAGTALKTVVARFSEVKKLYSEGDLMGSDEEGQEIDVNKIGTALRTAGINMNEFFLGTKGLDEIFMELGSKWNSLTTVQQRYIATLAAGSRQLSRFLALMQNYSRTLELTEMAYNSAGSSQEQFEKTLDSLASKINILKDEWNTFIMGIANSDLIKGFIDNGTAILTTINNIIDAISGGNGLIKSVTSLAAAFAVFKGGGALLKGGLGLIGAIFKTGGEGAKKGFLLGLTTATKGAIAGLRGQAGWAFTGNYLKNAFVPWQRTTEIADVKFNTLRLGLLNGMAGPQSFSGSMGKEFYAYQDAVLNYGANSLQAADSLLNLLLAAEKAGISLKEFGNIFSKNSSLISKTTGNILALGNAALLTGGILIGLATALESAGVMSKKTATWFKGAGAALLAFGTVLKITGAAVAAFSGEATVAISSIPIIGWVAAVIAAFTALGVVLYNTFSLKALANAAEKFAEEAKTAADLAKQSFEELEKSIEEILSLESVFDNLIIGTTEWDDAVQKLNQSILELILLYPELAGAVEYVDGHLSLNTKSKEYLDWIEKEKQGVKDTNTAANVANFEANRARAKSNVTGSEILNWLSLPFGGTLHLDINVFEKGLRAELEASEVAPKIINELLKGIHNGTIIDNNTLDAFLKTINDESEINKIKETFKKNELITNLEWDETTHSDTVRKEEITVDYTDAFIKAEKERYDVYNRSNFIGLASLIIDNIGFNNSEYANMWALFIAQSFADGLLSDNIDTSQIEKKYSQEDVAKLYGKEKITPDEYNNFLKFKALEELIPNSEEFNFLLSLEGNNLAWANALITGNTDNLTLEQLLHVPEELFENAAKVFGEKFDDYFLIDQKGATDIYDNLFKGYEKYQESILSVSDTTGLVEAYKKSIDTLRAQGVSDSEISGIFTTFNNSLEGLNEELKEQVKSLFSTIDFSSRTSIRNVVNLLDEFGIATDGLADKLIKVSKAINQISETKLSERLEGLEDTKSAFEKIASGEGKTITQKQYDAAVAAGFDFKADEWIKTGTKEWTYIGSETNSLLTSIDGVVALIAGDLESDTKDAVDRGAAIAETIDKGKTFYGTNKEGLTGWFTLPDIIESWQNIIEKNEDWGKGLADKEIAEIVGLSEDNATRLDVIDAFLLYYGANGAAYKANLLTYNLLMDKYGTLFAATMSSGLAMLNATEVSGYDKEGRFLEEEDVNKALKLNLEEGDEEYIKYLEKALNLTEEYDSALMALVGDSKKVKLSFDNLNKVYKDNADALTEDKKDTSLYRNALTKLTTAAKKAFGGSEAITSEFVENHLDKFKDMSEGSEDALKEIRKDVLTELLGTVKEGTAEAKGLETAINILDGADFSIGGTFDASSIINNLNLTEEEAKETLKKLNALGFSATMKVLDYDEFGVPKGYQLVVEDTGGKAINEAKSSGGGGGGGGGKEFKNDFDKYYNMVEDSNELERLRNLLETDYNLLLKEETKSAKQIYDNLKQQIKLLRERATIEADLAEKRRQQIIDTMSQKEYQGLQKYAWWNDLDKTVEINWDLINTVKDSEQGSLIKEYVSKMEDFQSKYDEAIETLEDIESTIQEIEKRGREQYTTLEDRVRDSLIKQIQDKIDELSAVDEAINDTNQKLFDSINETLELQRQGRDNAKTEEELTDKEKRLAYLLQDSSNANALEIAKLLEELANARQDYTDTLIDQRISELQRQNDEAQEQRQQQIELMQLSLDWLEKSGEFWNEAYRIMSEGADATGELVKTSELSLLLKGGEAWDSLSEEGKMKWLEELEDIVAQGLAYLEISRQLEDIGTKAGTSISFTTADGRTLTGTVDKNGNVVVKDANGGSTTYKDVYQDYHGAYKTYETAKEAAGTTKPATNTSSATSAASAGSGETAGSWALVKNGEGIVTKIWGRPGNSGQYKTYKEAAAAANLINNGIRTNKLKEIDRLKLQYELLGQKASGGKITATELGQAESLREQISELENKLKALQIPAFKTGGVADFTGPAWLDGTKSRPELVLNARDTENFILLKDTLADMKKSSDFFGSKGDAYFDIDILVDQMSSDYDVDLAIDRIKARIAQDGAYRNVNTLSRLR